MQMNSLASHLLAVELKWCDLAMLVQMTTTANWLKQQCGVQVFSSKLDVAYHVSC